ncbi:MAG: hypothetical protein D6796_08815 [Caldilineae bacterium]|nr:MAG: hypothetical protein D6796_08815 [Caldilineae bacterium]
MQANFDPAEHKRALGRLCRAVDGLPLAIELAASWVQVMEVADILTQVEQHPDRLTARWRDQPPRHRSLLGVFEHSWRLLSPREQEAYLCLSVFRGEFTAEAARAVAGAGLSLLTGLVDKSLLRHKDGRYAAHPLLVQFAAGKLAGRPALYEQAKHRHARYYGDFTRQLEPVLLGGNLEKGLRRVRPELDDLRLAWQTAVENRDVRLINNLADSFMQIFDMFGLYREIRDMAVRAIQALEGRVDPRQREDALALGRAYGLSAAFHFRLGDYEQALAHGQASLSLIAPFQPDVAYGHSLIYAGAAAYGLGEGEQAIAYWQKGVEAYRAAGSIWGETVANANLAEGTLSQEKPVEAEQYASRAYTLARRINNAELMAVALQILAVVALQQGNFEQATARGEQAVALHRQVGHRAHIANALAILARIDAARGDTQQALARLEESVVILRLLGNRLYLHQRLLELGQLAMKAGRWEMAEAALREITGQADSAGKTDVTSEALRLLAELHR